MNRYATAIAPSLHLTDPRPLSAAPGTALVLGVSESVRGYVELPNVEREVAAVHDIGGGHSTILSAGRASRPS